MSMTLKTALRFTRYRDIDPAPRKFFLVGKFLGDGEVSCIFAPPGVGKSVVATDLAAHVAAGLPWLGRQVLQGAVLYVAAERHKLVERRLAAFRKHHGLDDLPLAVVSGAVDLRSSPEHAALIVAYAKCLTEETGYPVRLIIIDTVSRVLAGGDENSPKDMGYLVVSLAALHEATKAHICTIHHVPQDGQMRLRGHGSLLGALDTTIAVTKLKGGRNATIIKDNDGLEGEHIDFELNSILLSSDPDTGQETWAPIVIPVDCQAPTRAAPKQNPLTRSQRIALSSLHDAVSEFGVPVAQDDHVPSDMRVVTLKQWADYAYRRGISGSDKPRARQKAFKEAREALTVMGKAAVWDPYAWPLADS